MEKRRVTMQGDALTAVGMPLAVEQKHLTSNLRQQT